MVAGKLKRKCVSFLNMKNYSLNLLAISTELFGSTMPQLGRTQYFLGAVVLILNATFLSDGFFRLMCDVTGCVNGPKKNQIKSIDEIVKSYGRSGV